MGQMDLLCLQRVQFFQRAWQQTRHHVQNLCTWGFCATCKPTEQNFRTVFGKQLHDGFGAMCVIVHAIHTIGLLQLLDERLFVVGLDGIDVVRLEGVERHHWLLLEKLKACFHKFLGRCCAFFHRRVQIFHVVAGKQTVLVLIVLVESALARANLVDDFVDLDFVDRLGFEKFDQSIFNVFFCMHSNLLASRKKSI